eukprot:173751_1
MVFGVIGGTNFLKSKFFCDFEKVELKGPYGPVKLWRSGDVVFCQRHQSNPDVEYQPPHLINFQAIAWGMNELGVETVVAFTSVGSMKPEIPKGSIVVVDDYFNLFRPVSMFDDRRGHLVIQFDDPTRQRVMRVLDKIGTKYIGKGVYCNVTGPRFESFAEIRFLATVGDVVGMMAAYELTCLTEMGIAYATVSFADNMANGIHSEVLSPEQLEEDLATNLAKMELVLSGVLEEFSGSKAK